MNEFDVQQNLATMLSMQDEINSQINQNWRLANNPWHRAMWTEAAELVEHIGWKWWKKQEPDINQVHLEVIDIWHFGLSDVLQQAGDKEAALKSLLPDSLQFSRITQIPQFSKKECLELVEDFAESTLANKSFASPEFFKMAANVGLDFKSIYVQYVGKNTLNSFRQTHGYKNGTYVKDWLGREDNECLVELISKLDTSSSSFRVNLLAALEDYYVNKVTK